MQPITKTDKPIHYPSDDTEAENIKNKLLAFRLQNYFKINADEETVQELEFPRLKQSALAITTIAKFIGVPKIITESINFLKEYEKELTISQQSDVKADVLYCIAIIIGSRGKSPYKLGIGEIAIDFNRRFYSDYSDKEIKIRETHYQIFEHKDYVVSARKIGSIVRKLNIRTERSGNGFYIPIPQESEKIELLVKRYGLQEIIQTQIEAMKPKPQPKKKRREDDSDTLF